jgi:hypothetical protein
LDEQGEVVRERSVATTRQGLSGVLGALGRAGVALEVGTHSPWVSRLATDCGHEVIVANSRNLRLITESSRKDDRLEARTLARVDPQLLTPIRHRSAAAQGQLRVIRARAALVDARAALIQHGTRSGEGGGGAVAGRGYGSDRDAPVRGAERSTAAGHRRDIVNTG